MDGDVDDLEALRCGPEKVLIQCQTQHGQPSLSWRRRVRESCFDQVVKAQVWQAQGWIIEDVDGVIKQEVSPDAGEIKHRGTSQDEEGEQVSGESLHVSEVFEHKKGPDLRALSLPGAKRL